MHVPCRSAGVLVFYDAALYDSPIPIQVGHRFFVKLSPVITIVAAGIAVVVVGLAALLLIHPPLPLLTQVALNQTSIAPGDDRSDSSALIRYTLNRPAPVTISFQSKANGQVYTFRDHLMRMPGDYQVNFSGVVDGYHLPGETAESLGGEVLARLIPAGVYQWKVEADNPDGSAINQQGDLAITPVDAALPAIQDFSISPLVFTPNQDGIDDRVAINVYLAKAATLSVYLQSADGVRYDMPERIEGRQPGEKGAHIFDYDGGVDNKVTPPPNGLYTVIAESQDAAGQIVRRTGQLTIRDSGLPQAEIQPQTSGGIVTYGTQPFTGQQTVSAPAGVTAIQSTVQMMQGDLLSFRTTVYNYGTTPIRTLGPWPGTVYQDNQLDGAFLNGTPYVRSGAWRIGFECETSDTNFPWRWAIGSPDELTKVTDAQGHDYYYLMPGKSATVWGGIVMKQLITSRNPKQCWAALIHEDVAIDPLQSTVGTVSVRLIATGSTSPSPANTTVSPTAVF